MTTEQKLVIETIAGKYFPGHPEWVEFVPKSFDYLASTKLNLDDVDNKTKTIEVIKTQIRAVLPEKISEIELYTHVNNVLQAIIERL